MAIVIHKNLSTIVTTNAVAGTTYEHGPNVVYRFTIQDTPVPKIDLSRGPKVIKPTKKYKKRKAKK